MPAAVQAPDGATARPQLWRITDRRTFQALRRSRRRVRRGPLTITWMPPEPGSPGPPRVGFAVGRANGGAVTRNRVRRRLRAALRELLVGGRLPAGTYLVGATADVATMPWSALVPALEAAVAEVTA